MNKKRIKMAKQLDRRAADARQVAIGSDVHFLSPLALGETWPCNQSLIGI
jgi:hypothetical protein